MEPILAGRTRRSDTQPAEKLFHQNTFSTCMVVVTRRRWMWSFLITKMAASRGA